ncbi:hypothetical protein CC78DRAFT_538017 [Lojkania enalia]|uniref:Uncharacterized protein n=1 Tax=Lojkania enalia TaxID=147567 RepID=A0A9P4JX49_9PLEO|nr:hypothetical protein CC78DRAFT_538017 [Didymosphaeria enalia]
MLVLGSLSVHICLNIITLSLLTISVRATAIAILPSRQTIQTQSPNLTLALPTGTTNHNNPHLLCTPTKWTDILTFYLGNYVTHALTVVVLPGEQPVSYLTNAFTSLLFPAFGAYRGLRAISVGYVSLKKAFREGVSWRGFKNWLWGNEDDESDLQKARRCGALCMIVRATDWRPRDGDVVEGCVIRTEIPEPEKKVKKKNKKSKNETTAGVHEVGLDEQKLLGTEDIELGNVSGSNRSSEAVPSDPTVQFTTYPALWTYCRQEGPDRIGSRAVRNCPEELSPGYQIVMVPSCTPVRELPEDTYTDRIGSTYSLVKGIVALAQAAFAIKTLYQARGNQIEKYGYAAFGLTVAPYALMSFVNLLGALSRPEYDAIYLVGSPMMVEERRRKGLDGYYESVVGELLPADANFSFDKHKVLAGMSFVRSPVRFKYVNEDMHVEYVPNEGQQEVSEKLIELPMDSDLSKPTLFIPSTPPFTYYQRVEGTATNALPAPSYRHSHFCYAFILNQGDQPGLLPRSVRYLENSRSLSFFVSLLPLIPIGVLSHFKKGESKVSQRAVTMLWLSWGAFCGWLIAEMGVKDVLGERMKGRFKLRSVGLRGFWYLCIGAPAIAGYVVVGQMLDEYGTCLVLPD